MASELKKSIVGQDHVLSAISKTIIRSRAGLSDPSNPLGTFIFLGSTGVGKTETANSLAQFLFNETDSLIRIDMSEYMEKHSVSKLIGISTTLDVCKSLGLIERCTDE